MEARRETAKEGTEEETRQGKGGKEKREKERMVGRTRGGCEAERERERV